MTVSTTSPTNPVIMSTPAWEQPQTNCVRVALCRRFRVIASVSE